MMPVENKIDRVALPVVDSVPAIDATPIAESEQIAVLPSDSVTSGKAGKGQIIANCGTLVAAVMASACCWLPLLLLVLGVSGAGMAAALATYRPLLIVLTFGFLGAAFYFTYRPRPMGGHRGVSKKSRQPSGQPQEDCCAQPNSPTGTSDVQRASDAAQEDCCAPATGRKPWITMLGLNKVMLWVVTVLAVLFLFFPGQVTRWLGGGQVITADMERTVLIVEGMT